MRPSPLLASVLCATAVAALSACASYKGPVGYVDGRPFTRTDPHLYPVIVRRVDGETYNYDYRLATAVPAGEHVFTLQAPLSKYSHVPETRDIKVKVEPCMRYTFGAKRAADFAEDFEPVLVETQPMPGCNSNSR